MRARASVSAALAAAACLVTAALAQPGRAPSDTLARPSAADWPAINRDSAATRFSPLAEIDAGNVASLTEAWTYALGANSTAVPVVVDGRMYVPSGDRVVALDGATGEPIWSYSLPRLESGSDGPAPGGLSASRGRP